MKEQSTGRCMLRLSKGKAVTSIDRLVALYTHVVGDRLGYPVIRRMDVPGVAVVAVPLGGAIAAGWQLVGAIGAVQSAK